MSEETKPSANATNHDGRVSPGNGSKRWNTLSILGFTFSWISGIVGLILSILGYMRTNPDREKGRGLALAGIIVSTAHLLALAGILWGVLNGYITVDGGAGPMVGGQLG